MPHIIEVYLQEDSFNEVCNARIPGSWVAVLENKYLGQITLPFAYPSQYENATEAMKGAQRQFNEG